MFNINKYTSVYEVVAAHAGEILNPSTSLSAIKREQKLSNLTWKEGDNNLELIEIALKISYVTSLYTSYLAAMQLITPLNIETTFNPNLIMNNIIPLSISPNTITLPMVLTFKCNSNTVFEFVSPNPAYFIKSGVYVFDENFNYLGNLINSEDGYEAYNNNTSGRTLIVDIPNFYIVYVITENRGE